MRAHPGSSQQQLVFRMCKMLISAQTSASATCHQYLDGPQLSPTSLGWERGRGYSVLVSCAMAQGMLWCREVWRGWQLRKQVMQTSSLHQKAPPRVDKWQQKLQGYPARPCQAGDAQALVFLQPGQEETRARRELLGTAMGMRAHPPGGKQHHA